MADDRKSFNKRLTRLKRRHAAMGNGARAVMRGDGLIVLEPRHIQFNMPLRGFVLLMAFFMTFKGFVLSHLGYDGYEERLAVLQSGTVLEQGGAFVMGIDPVSRVIADILVSVV